VASTRVRRLDEAGQQRLIGVAIRHFGAQGFERASLNEIIAEAGISKGSYYHLFEDKRALFLAALRSVVLELYREVPPPVAPRSRATFWREMGDHMQAMVAALRHHPEMIAFFGAFQRTQLSDPMFDPARAEGRELYLPFLRAGQKLGCVRDDVALETLASIWEAADAAFDQTLMSRPGRLTTARIAAHAELAFDMFRRIFEVRATRARGAPRRR